MPSLNPSCESQAPALSRVAADSLVLGFSDGSAGKEPACNAGDTEGAGSIPGSGRSPGGGNGNPLQYDHREISWTEESRGLQSMGLQRAGRD